LTFFIVIKDKISSKYSLTNNKRLKIINIYQGFISFTRKSFKEFYISLVLSDE
jgi:hypothetical protein